jgi:predicted nucleotidyltransferase
MAQKILSKREVDILVKKLAKIAQRDNIPVSKAFVFGSYANGKARRKSDLDLCIVSPKFKDTLEAAAYFRTKIYTENLLKHIPIDLIVYEPKNFKQTSPLVYEILKTGREIKLT